MSKSGYPTPHTPTTRTEAGNRPTNDQSTCELIQSSLTRGVKINSAHLFHFNYYHIAIYIPLAIYGISVLKVGICQETAGGGFQNGRTAKNKVALSKF